MSTACATSKSVPTHARTSLNFFGGVWGTVRATEARVRYVCPTIWMTVQTVVIAHFRAHTSSNHLENTQGTSSCMSGPTSGWGTRSTYAVRRHVLASVHDVSIISFSTPVEVCVWTPVQSVRGQALPRPYGPQSPENKSAFVVIHARTDITVGRRHNVFYRLDVERRRVVAPLVPFRRLRSSRSVGPLNPFCLLVARLFARPSSASPPPPPSPFLSGSTPWAVS